MKEQECFREGDYAGWIRLQLIREINELRSIRTSSYEYTVINNQLLFPLLWEIRIGIAVLFHTSVKCESSFSLMKRVKSPFRSRMSDCTLDSIIRMKYTDEEEISKCIDHLIEIRRTRQRKKSSVF